MVRMAQRGTLRTFRRARERVDGGGDFRVEVEIGDGFVSSGWRRRVRRRRRRRRRRRGGSLRFVRGGLESVSSPSRHSNPWQRRRWRRRQEDRAALHDALLAMLRSGLPSSCTTTSVLATYLGVRVGSESSVSGAPFEEAAATLAHALRVDEAFFEHATSADAKCGLPLAFTLLALAMRRRRDGDAGGFAQCACFALLRLSSSRHFGAALNARVSPRWLPELELAELDGGTWRGTHADALVATTHALLTDGDASRTAPLISPLLTTLHNAAPHWKNLSSRASTRLVRLVERHARPETLFAQPDAYRDQLRELTGALSPIDRCLRHQPDENPRLVLAVLRGGAVFDALDAAGRGEMPTFDDRNPHRHRDGDDSYDDVYDSDDTSSCATSSSSTASEAPPPVARRPSAEWLRAYPRRVTAGDDPTRSSTSRADGAPRARVGIGRDEGPGAGAGGVSVGERGGFARRRTGAADNGAKVRRGRARGATVVAGVRDGTGAAEAAVGRDGVRAALRRAARAAVPGGGGEERGVERGRAPSRRRGARNLWMKNHENSIFRVADPDVEVRDVEGGRRARTNARGRRGVG